MIRLAAAPDRTLRLRVTGPAHAGDIVLTGALRGADGALWPLELITSTPATGASELLVRGLPAGETLHGDLIWRRGAQTVATATFVVVVADPASAPPPVLPRAPAPGQRLHLTAEGDMLDAICAARLGSEAAVPAVLALNPRLATLGPVYPWGVLIALPEAAPAPAAPRIRLWGRA